MIILMLNKTHPSGSLGSGVGVLPATEWRDASSPIREVDLWGAMTLLGWADAQGNVVKV